MPSNVLSAAIREAYASARSDVYYLNTLEISHPHLQPLYLVADRADHFMKLENGKIHQFLPCGFRFILPEVGDSGLQELSLAIDNVDRRPSDFVRQVVASNEPVTVTFRPYISTDLNMPAMIPPLSLFLTDIVINSVEVTGRATFADILNRSFLPDNYTRRKFPGL